MIDILALLQAIFLGAVQGLTEFLPISSSGHLKLFPWIFGWETPGLVFDTSLHLGTALALLAFFYKDFLRILQSIFAPKTLSKGSELKQYRNLALCIIIGMLPAGLVGLFFDDVIEGLFPSDIGTNGIITIGTTFIIFGILMLVADIYGKKKRDIAHLSIFDALLVGILQIFAFIPGASRSGVTITAGMAGGLDREAAARFSFLIGTPLTLAAGVFKLKDLVGIEMSTQLILYFTLGFITSAVVGYLCIKYFLQFLKSHSLAGFTGYRVIVGMLVILLALWR